HRDVTGLLGITPLPTLDTRPRADPGGNEQPADPGGHTPLAPVVQGEVKHWLNRAAETYDHGEYAESEEAYRRALEVLRALPDQDTSYDTADCLHGLALIHEALGRTQSAAELREQAIALLAEASRPDDKALKATLLAEAAGALARMHRSPEVSPPKAVSIQMCKRALQLIGPPPSSDEESALIVGLSRH